MQIRAAIFVALLALAIRANGSAIKVSASSWQVGSNPNAAFDGDRFSTNSIWRGAPANTWMWQGGFWANGAVTIGSIFQIQGDHDFVFENAPKNYRWMGSLDGANWTALEGAAITNEHRLFRMMRLRA